jgi:hypothetical protein
VIIVAAKPRKAATNAVDETVVNQENPGTSEEARPSTEPDVDKAAVPPKMAPAFPVDETVVNQENPGTFAVNRAPEPQIVTDSAGIAYDVSKGPSPELVQDGREEDKNRIRQTEAALDARSEPTKDDDYFTINFIESGLTYAQTVWKKGEFVQVHKSKEKPWMSMSDDEQKRRFGRVKFERR